MGGEEEAIPLEDNICEDGAFGTGSGTGSGSDSGSGSGPCPGANVHAAVSTIISDSNGCSNSVGERSLAI